MSNTVWGLSRTFSRNSSFSATVLKVGFGIDVEDEENEIIRTVDLALEGAGEAFVPGRFFVDLIPPLRHIPSWFPGAGFQKQFAVWRDAAYLLKDLPFEKRNTAYVSAHAAQIA